MDNIIKAIILGIVEGLTEFLPVSSTGHLIVVNEFINFTGTFAKMFDFFIQFGAIIPVIVYFRHKLLPFSRRQTPVQKQEILHVWSKIAVGIIPGLILGALFASTMEDHLMNPVVVAVALVVGGVVLILLEMKKRHGGYRSIAEIPYRTAFFIGLFQCLAMVPGTSRSAATIIGAMLLGVSRLAAAEFSFYLAVPTLFGASAYSMLKLLKGGATITGPQGLLLAIGFLVSMLVAWVVVAAFMKFISRHDFKPFGYYRIALGAFLIIYFCVLPH